MGWSLKNHGRKWILLILAFGSFDLYSKLLCARENDSFRGFYLSTDLGLNNLSNLTLNTGEFSGRSVSANNGIRWGVATGYAFPISEQLSVAPEFELGIIYNSLSQVNVPGVGSASTSGSLTQVPFLINMVFNWQLIPHLVAYAGGGAGFNISSLTIENSSNFSSETDFAWQGMAGIRYKVGRSQIGVGYKYMKFTPSGLEAVTDNSVLLGYTINFGGRR